MATLGGSFLRTKATHWGAWLSVFLMLSSVDTTPGFVGSDYTFVCFFPVCCCSGRTGRAGKTGTCVTLVTRKMEYMVPIIEVGGAMNHTANRFCGWLGVNILQDMGAEA